MKISKGDFLVIDTGKRMLIKARTVEEGTVSGINQTMKRGKDGRYEKRLPVTARTKEVIVNLGKSPPPGKVYGVKIEPLYQRVDTNTCGQILFFSDMKEKEVTATKNILIKTYKELKKQRLGGIPAQIEVRPPEGKYAGWYHFLPKAEEDVLCVKPDFAVQTPADMRYIIAHEYAHGIWFRMMRPDNIAKWIAMYDKHMALTSSEEDDLTDILNEVIDAGSVRDYMKDADEETLLIVKACLKHIRQVHGIDRKHLDSLMRNGHSIEDYWPTYVEFSEKNVIVSEYAQKSPEEFFAEAFSHNFIGKKIPKDVKDLLTRSLSQLQKGRVNGEEDATTEDSD
jgi:hypothetical protein